MLGDTGLVGAKGERVGPGDGGNTKIVVLGLAALAQPSRLHRREHAADELAELGRVDLNLALAAAEIFVVLVHGAALDGDAGVLLEVLLSLLLSSR